MNPAIGLVALYLGIGVAAAWNPPDAFRGWSDRLLVVTCWLPLWLAGWFGGGEG